MYKVCTIAEATDSRIATFYDSAERLTASTEPLTRLAGRLALLRPHDTFSLRRGPLARLVSDTTWQSAEDDSASYTLTRHVTAGKKLGDIIVAVTAIGTYGGAYNELRLDYLPKYGAVFSQKAELVDYVNPLPRLDLEARQMHESIERVQAGQLVLVAAGE